MKTILKILIAILSASRKALNYCIESFEAYSRFEQGMLDIDSLTEKNPTITITDEAHTTVNKNWFDRFDGKEFVEIEVYKGGKLVSANTKQKADEIMKKHIDPDFDRKEMLKDLTDKWIQHQNTRFNSYQELLDFNARPEVKGIDSLFPSALSDQEKADKMRAIIKRAKITVEREQIIDKIYKEIMER